MHGPPEDVSGECNAHLYIGDNHATMRCRLPANHDGPHRVDERKTAEVAISPESGSAAERARAEILDRTLVESWPRNNVSQAVLEDRR
jgi:hypothetical protein